MIVTSCDLCEPGLKWSGFDRESEEVVKGELSVPFVSSSVVYLMNENYIKVNIYMQSTNAPSTSASI